MGKKIFALALVAVLFICGTSSAAVEIKLAHVGSLEHQYQIGAVEFKRLVEERSNKGIIVNIFPQSQLGNERDAIEGIRMGTLEMTTVAAAGALPSFVPEISVLAVPYVLQTRKQAYAVLDGPFGEKLNKLIAKKNLMNLGYWEMGFRNFTNNVRPIKTPRDIKGLKIRVQESKSWMELIKMLGGVPTPIPFGELYSGLQQRVVDGQENPIATIYSMKFYEVQKYLTLDRHTYEATAVLVSPKWFNGLSKTNQEIIRKAVIDAGLIQRDKLAKLEQERINIIRKAGVKVEEKPDIKAFAEATKDLYKYLDQVPASLVNDFKDAAAKAPK